MMENTHEINLDALNAGIAKSREELLALGAELIKLAEWKPEGASIDVENPKEGPINGDKRQGGWTGFRHRLDNAGARGEKVARGIAVQIERHPLLGGLATFGLGFALARLVFKRSKKNSEQ